MLFALFGIDNDGVNLVVNLFILFLVVVWLALIYWTYVDARRRMEDPVLVACSVAAAVFPFIGTAVYAIVRPPEYLDDRRERELEIRAAELRVQRLEENLCPHCRNEVEKGFLRCPSCRRRLRDPCLACGKPLDPRWSLCPYCEAEVPEPAEPARRPRRKTEAKGRPQEAKERAPAGERRSKQKSDGPRRKAGSKRDAGKRPASSRSEGEEERRPAEARGKSQREAESDEAEAEARRERRRRRAATQ